MTTITHEQVAQFRQWASTNYSNGHADYMVECWSNQDYREALEEAGGSMQDAIDFHRSSIEAGRESAACYDNDGVYWGKE